eukprot:gnl/TRDRNA2_/TRDRNA2_176336_c0_seq1.p2 gnl/TRDRNA2_/TRDRNA2_176336_c0~~gnl/TRDRNA2_/TRDRNA2_176336_c0_seq1.p2  ORF type:complete len:305 (+),score=65.28 gnl/TRDRNA2_/TRDRNA2_176336_c0_seq1:1037-1951(+)
MGVHVSVHKDSSFYCGQEKLGAEAQTAPMKAKERCLEKLSGKYSEDGKYGVRELTDIVRGSLIFDDEDELCKAVKALEGTTTSGKAIVDPSLYAGPPNLFAAGVLPEGFSVEVVHLKNRFAKPALGYSDMLINLRLTSTADPIGHLVELQVHHKAMVNAKHKFHVVYKFLRLLTEDISLLKLDVFDWNVFLQDPATVEKYMKPLRDAAAKKPEDLAKLSDEMEVEFPDFKDSFTLKDLDSIVHGVTSGANTLRLVYHFLLEMMSKGYTDVSKDMFKSSMCSKSATLRLTEPSHSLVETCSTGQL